MTTGCTICGGLTSLDENWTSSAIFVEAFLLGVIVERTARFTSRSIASLVCTEHLKLLRHIASQLPPGSLGPMHARLLNLGLQAVD